MLRINTESCSAELVHSALDAASIRAVNLQEPLGTPSICHGALYLLSDVAAKRFTLPTEGGLVSALELGGRKMKRALAGTPGPNTHRKDGALGNRIPLSPEKQHEAAEIRSDGLNSTNHLKNDASQRRQASLSLWWQILRSCPSSSHGS